MALKFIPRIVLTGGPCGGKTSALAILRQKLAAYGVRVFVVPELATELFSNGISVAELAKDPVKWRALQAAMAKAQIQREDYWEEVALLSNDPLMLMICDRGIMDQAAFIDRDVFDGVLHDLRLSQAEVTDERYRAVFHMVTAARGAEANYTLENNIARTETIAEARERDTAALEAWQGHREVKIFPNARQGPKGEIIKVPFDEKLEMVLQAACQILSLPVPSRVERKYEVVKGFTLPKRWPVSMTTQLIEQTYLTGPENVERRIRRMSQEGRTSRPGALYIYTEKRAAADGGRLVTERPLTAQEYEGLRMEKDPESEVISKKRHTFIWQDQYFQLDEMNNGETMVLEVAQTSRTETVSLPPFIPIAREVSGEKKWQSRELARKSGRGLGR